MSDLETKVCPDCAETVLAAARVCKHCGYRFETLEEDEPFELAPPPPPAPKKRRLWPWLALGAGVCVVIATSDRQPTPRREPTPSSSIQPSSLNEAPSEATLKAQEFSYIRNTQRALSARLKDPDSAQFGEDYVSRKGGAPVVCGTVNARNSYGGYTGATRYVGAGDGGVFLESDVSDFSDLWRKMC